MARASSGVRFVTLHDGIIEWFNGPEIDELAFEEFEKAATELETKAKMDAPWADRTGAARAGITGEAFNQDGIVGVRLFHTVEYGQWLELIQNGRFAIIGPILEEHGRRITYNAVRRIRYARSRG